MAPTCGVFDRFEARPLVAFALALERLFDSRTRGYDEAGL